MLQLTYISTVTGTCAPELDVILAASRRNNARVGVTGLLLFDGRRFLQALEGEPAAVLQTYARIGADPRHRALVKLSERQIDTRDFGSWAMACELIDQPVVEQTLTETVDALTQNVADASTRSLFRSFVRLRAA